MPEGGGGSRVSVGLHHVYFVTARAEKVKKGGKNGDTDGFDSRVFDVCRGNDIRGNFVWI